MPALQTQTKVMTLEQYEALPENVRVEVFEGVVYDMVSPSVLHQRVSMELTTILNNYIKKNHGSCEVFSAPFDVKLNEHPLTIEFQVTHNLFIAPAISAGAVSFSLCIFNEPRDLNIDWHKQ